MSPANDRKEPLLFLLLFAVVLLSRLPLLNYGYGVEEDSWGIVRYVTQTFETGVYEESRLPGHPVHEALFLLAPNAGPWFYNGISAIMSVIATIYFAKSLKKIGFQNFLLPSFAFAFMPVIFISSTYTIDFTSSLACVMISFYLLVSQRPIVSGLFLGLAVGCRITSLAMIAPFFIIQSGIAPLKENFGDIIKLILVTLFVSVISYIPVFAIHGPGFFTFSDQFSYPSLPKVFYKATIGVFGLIGFLAIIYFLAVSALKKFTAPGFIKRENVFHKRMLLASVVTIIIYSISYLRLPQKSGYLIPIIPFVIIAFAYLINERQYRSLCFLLILSSFFFSVNLTDEKRGSVYSALALKLNVSGQEIFIDPLTGPVYSDHSKRIQKMNFTNEIIHDRSPNDSTIIICGWWYNEILVTLKESKMENERSHYVFYIDKAKMEELKAEGNAIFYLPEQDIYNDAYSKMNETAKLAAPYIFYSVRWRQ